MEQERKQESRLPEAAPDETSTLPKEPPRKPYSKKARILAWIGIAAMVFLTIMYYYVFASGIIINW